MNKKALYYWSRIALAGFALLSAGARQAAASDLWCTAYYPGWQQGYLAPTNIDFGTVTHLIHFSAVPVADGSLDANANSLSLDFSAAAVTQAHAAGRKILVCVGGAGSESGFVGAVTSTNRGGFITNIVNFMASRGYDGVDIDWEPLPVGDFAQYTNLLKDVRTALNALPQPKLLTVAAPAYPVYGDAPAGIYMMYNAIQGQLDQINVMTYDLSGPYSGWVTWFNAPLYDGGTQFQSGGLVPSTEGSITNYLGHGVAAGKLGIGIAFYAWVWSGGAGTSTSGVTKPRQSWTTAPTASSDYSFDNIMTGFYQSNRYHWDASAQAAYLSISNASASQDKFISYDDERACQAKVSYARNRALGGVMIWELGSGYRATQPAGQRDPLLQAIKQAVASPGKLGVSNQAPDIQLSFASMPLGAYRVLWASNLASTWNTLMTTNVATNVNGGMLQVTDAGAVTNQTERFYRVQTPP